MDLEGPGQFNKGRVTAALRHRVRGDHWLVVHIGKGWENEMKARQQCLVVKKKSHFPVFLPTWDEEGNANRLKTEFMNSQLYHRISLWMSILGIGFIAVYPLVIDFTFTLEQANWVFSLLYLTLCLNFLGGNQNEQETVSGRAQRIFKDKYSIVISTFLIVCFALILGQSDINSVIIFLVLICSLIFYYASLIFLRRKITQLIFWINFYLFTGIFILTQIPGSRIDLLSRFNPFGGLFLTLFA